MIRRGIALIAMLGVAGSALADGVVQMSALNSFGVNGWVAPGTVSNLGTGSLERGLAYNPITGNVLFTSRTSNVLQKIQVLNGTTGGFVSTLDVGGVTGGTFAGNMLGVANDGAIYMANLSTSATTPFKIYKWNDETAGVNPTVVFNATSGLVRTGDSFDVQGSGASTQFITSGSGSVGFASITDSGSGFTSTVGAVGAAGAFRLGITFGNANQVFGKATGAGNNLQVATISPASLNGTPALTAASEAPMDFANINGIPLLATVDITSSLVRIYDMTNPLAPVLRDSLTTTTGSLAANGNGVGQVKWGAESGNTATLYAMSTNQGIQAFSVNVVPEPGSMLAIGLGLGFLAIRRKK